MRTIPLPLTTVCVDGTAVVAIPATNWMKAADVAKVRANMELRGITGTNMNVGLGYQTANVENAPGGETLLGSYRTSADVYYGSSFESVSAQTDGKVLIRWVWLVKLSSGNTIATARVCGSVDVIPPV